MLDEEKGMIVDLWLMIKAILNDEAKKILPRKKRGMEANVEC